MPNIFHYNILVTLDRNYLKVLSVMLYSLSQSDPDAVFTVYVANNSLTEDDFSSLRTLIPRTEFVDVRVCDELLSGAPISDRYPKEMYFRLFAAQYLPQELDRILYLDRTLLSSTICADFIPSTFKIICLPLPPTSRAPFLRTLTVTAFIFPKKRAISIPVS